MMSSSKKSARWLRDGFIASIFAIVLAGCSQAEAERPELQKTTDASLAETAEYIPASAEGPAKNVPPPQLPSIATKDSEEGAEATLQYFWKAIDYARLTGDTGPLALVSHEVCSLCSEYIQGWGQRYSEGDWAVLHGDIEVEVSQLRKQQDEEANDEWVEIYFELTEPAADLYINGVRDAEESFDEPSSANWIADLSFDSSAERWVVEWAGLEEQVEEN